AQMTRRWVEEMGFGLFAAPGFESQTVTVVANTRAIDVGALNKALAARGLSIADGYGGLKGKTFRIAHMADTTEAEMRELFAAMNDYLSHV
ncbi:MAG: alanine--glyoxylate aminotransferase family protein, partial [Thermoflexales bacterium]